MGELDPLLKLLSAKLKKMNKANARGIKEVTFPPKKTFGFTVKEEDVGYYRGKKWVIDKVDPKSIAQEEGVCSGHCVVRIGDLDAELLATLVLEDITTLLESQNDSVLVVFEEPSEHCSSSVSSEESDAQTTNTKR